MGVEVIGKETHIEKETHMEDLGLKEGCGGEARKHLADEKWRDFVFQA